MKTYLKWGLLGLMLLMAAFAIWAVTDPKGVMETFFDMGGLQKGEPFVFVKGEEVEGGTVDLASYKGKKLVVMIAKIDCEVCQQTYPVLEKLKSDFPHTPFVMIAQGGKNDYAKVKQEHRFAFPVVHATPEIQQTLRFKVFPVFYLIDGEGKVARRINGFDEQELLAMLREGGETP